MAGPLYKTLPLSRTMDVSEQVQHCLQICYDIERGTACFVEASGAQQR